MSFRKENPIKSPPAYSDFSASFSRNVITNDVVRLNDIDAVKRSVKNLVMTDKYERLLDPALGAGISELLFEQMTPLTTVALRETIIQTLNQYEPRINIDTIDVTPDYDRNTYFISIAFSLVRNEQVGTVEFLLNRIR
jgi:phage baseplate assembly protein W